MNFIDFLKLEWRKVLAVQEEKESFFHGCKTLIHSKCYDRLFRNFRDLGVVEYYSTESSELYLRTNDGVIVKTDSYYAVFLEVFVNHIYMLPPQFYLTDFIVFDVGMNRGYATLYFANKAHCRHVYGFELVESTYEYALDNISLNPQLSSKITTYNYGLWDKDAIVDIAGDGIDGHFSVLDSTPLGGRGSVVRKSSTVIRSLFEQINSGCMKVLKIDVEGAEYRIFDELYREGLMAEFDIIVGEYHDGINQLYPYLSDFYSSYESPLIGNIGEMVFINKRFRAKKTK